MNEYDFRILFQLPIIGDLDEYVELLAAGGCDDALIGVSDSGLAELDFLRSDASAEAAMRSAVVDVTDLIPSAKFIEIAPDYVGVSDIARIVKVSRQHIRKLWLDNAYDFPQPIHISKSAVWRLAAVLPWLHTKMEISDYYCLLEMSSAAVLINADMSSCRKVESRKSIINRSFEGGSISITNYQFVRYQDTEVIEEFDSDYHRFPASNSPVFRIFPEAI